MKTKLFLGAATLALIGLNSCSSEEPVGPDGNQQKGDKYVAVQIHNVGTIGSRAGITDDDFEGGLANENTIEAQNTRFYFFDAEGNPFPLSVAGVDGVVTNTNMVKPFDLSSNPSNGDNCTATGVLILGFAPDDGYKGTAPSRMLCAANLSDDDFAKLAGKSCDEIKEQISTVESGIVDTQKFAMTSSTYAENEQSAIFWTDITGCLKDTYDEAQNNPAHVYIERLSAKVRVNGLDTYPAMEKKEDGSYEVATYKFYDPTTGTTVDRKLFVELNGWQMRNIYNTVRLVKRIEAGGSSTPLPQFTWNFPQLHRSFWAVTGTDATKLNSRTFNIYNESHFTKGNYPVDGTDAEKMAQTRYIYPSTNWWKQPRTLNTISGLTITTGTEEYPGSAITNRVVNTTGIVVKGTVYFEGADGKADKTTDNSFVYHAGTYYMLNDFKAFVAKAYNSQNGTNVAAGAISLEVVSTTDAQGATSGKNNHRQILVNGEPWEALGTVLFWDQGLCSFCVNIQHDTDNSSKPIFGIVRNHIYDLTLSSVIGLGTPGNDITTPEDEDETFLACHIDVLNWHLVKNTIVLE